MRSVWVVGVGVEDSGPRALGWGIMVHALVILRWEELG